MKRECFLVYNLIHNQRKWPGISQVIILYPNPQSKKMARDVTSYHSHNYLLTLSIEMDPIRGPMSRDTKKFKIDICYDIHIVYKPSKFPIRCMMVRDTKKIKIDIEVLS